MRDRGLRVDGIGWQAHVAVGWNTSSNRRALRLLIDWAHERDLEFHVTEASVFIDDDSTDQLEAQAGTYRRIVEELLEKRSGGVVGWNTWHISDAHGWRRDEYPSLFDEQYGPKPAYYAVQEELEEHRDLPVFLRGDGNEDGIVDLSDAVFALSWLFLGGRGPGCLAAVDANDDDIVDVADPSYLLNHLFLGAPPPPAPYPECDIAELDADVTLDCATRPPACP